MLARPKRKMMGYVEGTGGTTKSSRWSRWNNLMKKGKTQYGGYMSKYKINVQRSKLIEIND